jgi:hypothetical protein
VVAALVAHGLPATFLDDLDAAILAFETTIRDHDTSRSTFATARAGVRAALGAGLTAVQRLDAVVPNLLRDDPGTFAGWEHARHVERSPRTRKASRKPPSTVPETPPTAVTPADAPAPTTTSD